MVNPNIIIVYQNIQLYELGGTKRRERQRKTRCKIEKN